MFSGSVFGVCVILRTFSLLVTFDMVFTTNGATATTQITTTAETNCTCEPWSTWSPCQPTMAVGNQTRQRQCTDMIPDANCSNDPMVVTTEKSQCSTVFMMSATNPATSAAVTTEPRATANCPTTSSSSSSSESDKPSWLIFYAACVGSAVFGGMVTAAYVHCCCTRPARKKVAKFYLEGGGHVGINRNTSAISLPSLSPVSETDAEAPQQPAGEDRRGSDGTHRVFTKERLAQARAARLSKSDQYIPSAATSPMSQKSFFSATESTDSFGINSAEPVKSAKSYR